VQKYIDFGHLVEKLGLAAFASSLSRLWVSDMTKRVVFRAPMMAEVLTDSLGDLEVSALLSGDVTVVLMKSQAVVEQISHLRRSDQGFERFYGGKTVTVASKMPSNGFCSRHLRSRRGQVKMSQLGKHTSTLLVPNECECIGHIQHFLRA
jgi:hypothetical protein